MKPDFLMERIYIRLAMQQQLKTVYSKLNLALARYKDLLSEHPYHHSSPRIPLSTNALDPAWTTG